MKQASRAQRIWRGIQERLHFRLKVTFPGKWKWRTLVYRRWQNEHLLSIGKFRFDWQIGDRIPW